MRWPFVRRLEHELLQRLYNDLRNELIKQRVNYVDLLAQWNALVKRINDRGGEPFLSGPAVFGSPEKLSEQDLKKLLMLCHPDKHGNSELAKEMTVKILEMRN